MKKDENIMTDLIILPHFRYGRPNLLYADNLSHVLNAGILGYVLIVWQLRIVNNAFKTRTG